MSHKQDEMAFHCIDPAFSCTICNNGSSKIKTGSPGRWVPGQLKVLRQNVHMSFGQYSAGTVLVIGVGIPKPRKSFLHEAAGSTPRYCRTAAV